MDTLLKQIQPILDELKITIQGELIDSKYVIIYKTYDEFTQVYNELEKSVVFKKDSYLSYLNEHSCYIEFYNENYIIILEGDFKLDKYTLTIQEDVQ